MPASASIPTRAPCGVRALAGRAAVSMARHPWRWVAAVVVVLMVVPAIDITVSSWFWDPVDHVFVARNWPPGEWVRRSMPAYLLGAAGYIALLWLAGEALDLVFLGITRRVAVYLLSSLALGPGVVVNLILKDYWGRPRPSTILQFGGSDSYVAPMAISNGCDHNCSFPSGHAALGFWLVAFALLAPPRWRPHAIAAAVTAGAAVGVVRIAQGGHFLSDVVFSAIITISISVWLHRRLVARADTDVPEK
jgi:lipid A 4'-phosphatase